MHRKTDPDRELKEIDLAIRRGQAAVARSRVEALAKKRPSRRESLSELASLAIRAGIPMVGIRLLNPLVRGSGRLAPSAAAYECAVYAQCLNRVGAPEEATALLDGIDPHEVPDALLYRAHSLAMQWEYEATIPLYTAYLEAKRVSSYKKLVAKVNLATALAFAGRNVSAQSLLRSLLHDTSARGLRLLRANTLEVCAQFSLRRRLWDDCERFLDEAQDILRGAGTVDALFVKKWRAIARLLRSRGKDRAPLEETRAEALERRHWETVRDCDSYLAGATGDTKLFLHVYFGTPFASFRRRFLAGFPGPVSLPERYSWGGESGTSLDLGSGEVKPNGPTLKKGHLLQRLLAALAKDFYRPLRVAAAAYALYPDEYFNPASSPMRVHEAVRRLRQWLEANRLPLEVIEEEGAYRLDPHGCAILVPRPEVAHELGQSPVAKLKRHWPEGPFSASEAARLLELPPRTVQRILEGEVAGGALERSGKARATRYRFSRG